MSLTELQAQRVVLVKSLEQAQDTGGRWSASDAKEATRATNELVGKKVPFDQFLARRAEWVIEELNKRKPNEKIDVRLPRWPMSAGWLLIVMAMTVGLLTDHLATDQRVNIIAYPLLLLVLWNLLVCLWSVSQWFSQLFTPKHTQGSLLLNMVGKWRLHGAISIAAGKGVPWVDNFKTEWSSASARLNQARLNLAFHSAAVCFTLGVVLGLFLRALVKGYMACWDTSFVEVSAGTVHAIASLVLTPGAVLLNRSLPDVQHIAGLHCRSTNGELAGPWIILYIGSILAWIIIPRMLLGASAGITNWRLRRTFPLPINNAYFNTLRAVRSGNAVGVLAIPFRYELTAQIRSNLAKLLERVHGLAVTISVQKPVLMGEDSGDWKTALGNERHIAFFVIFNLTATAEPDAHSQLLRRILEDVDGRAPVIPIVDTSTYDDSSTERFNQRCNQWRSALDEVQCKPLFINLMNPEDEKALLALGARLNEYD
jgi:hypothetical protein